MLAVVWTLNVSDIPPAKADIPVSPSFLGKVSGGKRSGVAKDWIYATSETQQFRDDSTGPKVRGQFKRHEPQDLEGGFCYLAADGHK